MHCYCGAISWKVVGTVAYTAVCHCRDCQTISGSAYGSTSLMIYDPKGVEFQGDEPKVFHAESEQGNPTQRGFCGTCGTVLFNHVSEGREDEHWAMRTGSMVDSRALRMEKEIFMKSKLSWVPIVTKPDSHYIGMPKKGVKKDKHQKTIEETSQTTIGSQKRQKTSKDEEASSNKEATVEDGDDED